MSEGTWGSEVGAMSMELEQRGVQITDADEGLEPREVEGVEGLLVGDVVLQVWAEGPVL